MGRATEALHLVLFSSFTAGFSFNVTDAVAAGSERVFGGNFGYLGDTIFVTWNERILPESAELLLHSLHA